MGICFRSASPRKIERGRFLDLESLLDHVEEGGVCKRYQRSGLARWRRGRSVSHRGAWTIEECEPRAFAGDRKLSACGLVAPVYREIPVRSLYQGSDLAIFCWKNKPFLEVAKP